MTQSNTEKSNRVLARWGARELSADELRSVFGGAGKMTLSNGTSHPSGDSVQVQDDNPTE